MNRRPALRDKLRYVLESFGTWLWDPIDIDPEKLDETVKQGAADHVYFQPPESVKLSYPCIIYQFKGIFIERADNGQYRRKRRYEIFVIDQNPDSQIPDRLLDVLPTARHDNHYTSDNLHHDVFTLYW